MNVVNILPNESIKYAKETQTTESSNKSSHPLNEDDDLEHGDKHDNIFQDDLKKSAFLDLF